MTWKFKNSFLNGKYMSEPENTSQEKKLWENTGDENSC